MKSELNMEPGLEKTPEERLREEVASYLYTIANMVQQNQIDGFQLTWEGGTEVSSKLKLKQPIKHIVLETTIGDPNE